MTSREPQANQTAQEASPTARPTHDSMGLGRTSGQRGAEIFAGIRAENFPSPLTNALATWGGRVSARVLMALSKRFIRDMQPNTNYMIVRNKGLTQLVQAELPEDQSDLLLIDIGSGFSPRGVELAWALPHAQIVEIDLPDVVREKQARLERARDVEAPTNIRWLAADLGVVQLAEVLGDLRADVISAEGLTPYFPPNELIEMTSHFRACMKPHGVFVSDMAWKAGNRAAGPGASFVSRQAGRYLGAMEDQEQACSIFEAAGYAETMIYMPTEVAQRFDLPQPVADLQFMVVARNQAKSPAAE
ncbi:MAG: class I SAM-dependent methyltransferase [Chloroflexi bacterium]|nr:class I SAM-dependent methyltransferase [Chloroflexota bacterium]